MNGEMRESEQVLFGLQSVFMRDNASLIVAQWFKFNAKESIDYGAGAPAVRGQMSGRVWEGEMGSRCVLRSDRVTSFALSVKEEIREKNEK